MNKNRHITIKEKIIVHLYENLLEEPIFEADKNITQDGIAETVNTRRSYVASSVIGLKNDGYLKEVISRVKGEERKRKIYLLTQDGIEFAKKLIVSIKNKKVYIEKDGKKISIKISEINGFYHRKFQLIEILNNINNENIFTLPEKKIKLPDVKIIRDYSEPPQKNNEKLKKTKSEVNDFRSLILGILFCYFFVFIFEKATGMRNDMESVYSFLIIIFPIYAIILSKKFLNLKIRTQISLTLGAFFILFGIFIPLPNKIFNWYDIYSAYWLIFGISLILIPHGFIQIDDLDNKRFISIGIFIFIAIFLGSIIINENLDNVEKISVFSWIFFFIILILLFLFKPNESHILFMNFQYLSIGTLFIFISVFLFSKEKYMESILEILIGLLMMGYSVKNLEMKNKLLLIYKSIVIIFIIILEITTCLIFFNF